MNEYLDPPEFEREAQEFPEEDVERVCSSWGAAKSTEFFLDGKMLTNPMFAGKGLGIATASLAAALLASHMNTTENAHAQGPKMLTPIELLEMTSKKLDAHLNKFGIKGVRLMVVRRDPS